MKYLSLSRIPKRQLIREQVNQILNGYCFSFSTKVHFGYKFFHDLQQTLIEKNEPWPSLLVMGENKKRWIPLLLPSSLPDDLVVTSHVDQDNGWKKLSIPELFCDVLDLKDKDWVLEYQTARSPDPTVMTTSGDSMQNIHDTDTSSQEGQGSS